MAFLICLALTGIILFGAYRYVAQPEARTAAHEALRRNPKDWAFAILGVAALLTFFWGVFVPSFGGIEVPLGGYSSLRLWQIGGIGTAVWLALYILTGRLGT